MRKRRENIEKIKSLVFEKKQPKKKVQKKVEKKVEDKKEEKPKKKKKGFFSK